LREEVVLNERETKRITHAEIKEEEREENYNKREEEEKKMSEFTPPSYSGDPNSARCEQECFTLGFISLNAAVLMKCLGGSRLLLDARPRMNGDLALAMAEEADNKKRRKKGLPEINRREKLGATQFMWQQRWQEYYRARNGI
jgi:hypothetical protein